MTIKKNEMKLLIILIVLVFSFVFVKFVLLTSIPKIKEAKVRLGEVKSQKAALDEEYQNIENYNTAIAAKTTVDERLGEYLMNNAGLSDSIEFIEKLASMMGTEIKKISLGAPSQMKEKGGIAYYGFPISFDANLSYGELKDLMKYCEGGSRKVRVDSFNITPDENLGIEDSTDDQLFNSSLSLVFYSMDKDAANKLYQFSRSRLQGFERSDGSIIFIKEDAQLPDADLPQRLSTTPSKITGTTQEKKTNESVISKSNADFLVFHRGYLFGGYNFETYSAFNSQKRIRKTTAGKVDVFLTLENGTFTLQAVDDKGNSEKTTHEIPDRNFTMYIQSEIETFVRENDGLQVDIRVKNDSDKTIRVHISQKGNRVKLMDRDGNEITTKSEKEKVYI